MFNGYSLNGILANLESRCTIAGQNYIEMLTAVKQAIDEYYDGTVEFNSKNVEEFNFEWGDYRYANPGECFNDSLRDVIFKIIEVESFGELHDFLGKTTSAHDELIGVLRYVELEMHYLNHLRDIVKALNVQNDFDLIVALGDDSKIKLLPSSITSIEDLLEVDAKSSQNLFLNEENIDYGAHVISQLDLFGSKIKNKLKGIVDFVEQLVENRSNRIASFGINVKKEIVISDELQLCSYKIYESEPNVTTCTALNTILALAGCKDENCYYSIIGGYVVKNNELMIYKNCYVHEQGYLVSFNGECLRSLNDSDEL